MTAPEDGLWTCPACAFSFSREHEDEGGGYSCPLCRVAALEAGLRKMSERDDCGCDCDDEHCCVRVGVPCPECEARALLSQGGK